MSEKNKNTNKRKNGPDFLFWLPHLMQKWEMDVNDFKPSLCPWQGTCFVPSKTGSEQVRTARMQKNPPAWYCIGYFTDPPAGETVYVRSMLRRN